MGRLPGEPQHSVPMPHLPERLQGLAGAAARGVQGARRGRQHVVCALCVQGAPARGLRRGGPLAGGARGRLPCCLVAGGGGLHLLRGRQLLPQQHCKGERPRAGGSCACSEAQLDAWMAYWGRCACTCSPEMPLARAGLEEWA